MLPILHVPRIAKEPLSRAEETKIEDALVRKMRTPPYDLEVVPEIKPTSYEKLNEIADDLAGEGETVREKWSERAPTLWDSVGKKK